MQCNDLGYRLRIRSRVCCISQYRREVKLCEMNEPKALGCVRRTKRWMDRPGKVRGNDQGEVEDWRLEVSGVRMIQESEEEK